MTGKVFTSRYRAGVFFSPGGGLLILPFLFVPGMGLFKSVLMAGLFALAAFAVSTWWWTRRRTRDAALVLSDAGAEIEGLALIPWRQIAGVHRGHDAAGKPALMIALNAPAQRRGQSPLWQADPRAIMLRVALLADPVDEIEGAFLAFIRA